MRLVAVDIGGTHARFALTEVESGRVTTLGDPVTLKTADYGCFEAAWAAFAAAQPDPLPRAAAIAIACPVVGDELRLTNNSWVIRPAALDAALGIERHALVNDFEAVAHAVANVGADHLQDVCGPQGPLPDAGAITIVGPGTGLGVAQLLRLGSDYRVIATEGGHIAFAPHDAVEDALLGRLRAQHGRVSVERVVSGPGLGVIYRLLAAIEGRMPVALDDAELWSAALLQLDPFPAAALERFCAILGGIAGDLALAHGPSGVVIAGGLGLRVSPYLGGSRFAARFVAKGRFSALMATVPVKIIVHPQPGLFGAAAAFAREFAR